MTKKVADLKQASCFPDFVVPAAEEAARERPAAVPEQARKPPAEHQERQPRGLRQLLVQGGEPSGKGPSLHFNLR